jgi:hypothetical protein
LEPVQQLAAVVATLTRLVGRIEPDQLAEGPPSAKGVAVAELVEGSIRHAIAAACALRGQPATGLPRGAQPVRLGTHPAARVRAVMADLLKACQEPEARNPITAPLDPRQRDVLVRTCASELSECVRDLARATNQLYCAPHP